MKDAGEFPVPANLAAAVRTEGRRGWLATLPPMLRRLEREWSIQVGAPFEPGGQTAWVAPASRRDGADAVVKILWRHPEAEREADALRIWEGDGAVRLFAYEAVDEESIALLLERCRPGTTLEAWPEPDQDVVIAGLLKRLWREAPTEPAFASLQAMCDRWADEFERNAATRGGRLPLDAGVAREGISLFRSLPRDARSTVLLCTDLHAGNVLAAEREPWLAIDPKPVVGDPTYDALQHLLNCDDRLRADPIGLVHRMAELLDLDAERLLRWLFARCVQESLDWPGLAAVAETVARSMST
ncbi:MAG TPA: aminoglycoside phosphotransferase family protein [Actinomycetota bacterium]